MERRLGLWAGAAGMCGILAAGCGSSGSLASNLAPSGNVTLSSVTLNVNTPSVGGGVQATATANFSNGSTAPIVSGFGTDTPSVATATSSGTITGVAIGDVTIFVDYQGMHASKKVHVLPSYSGTYSGTYLVVTCTQTDGWVDRNICGQLAPGVTAPIAFLNTQPSDLSAVSGQFAIGQLPGTGTGTVSSTGTLTYGGSIILGTARMDFRNFTATSPTPGRITGSFDEIWTDSAITGSVIVTSTTLDATRIASVVTSLSGPLAVRSGGFSTIAALLMRPGRW